MTLCSTFQKLAFQTWKLLSIGNQVDYQPHEQTITDLNLLEVKQLHPYEIRTMNVTQTQENIIGADWEWWLTGPSKKWLGLRVQAKVINIKTGSFQHLHYLPSKNKLSQSKNNLYQSDTLIKQALENQDHNNQPFPLLPLYCLYSYWQHGGESENHRICKTYSVSNESYGCSWMSAFSVRSLRINGHQKDIKSLLPHMKPWHCLICCKGYGGSDLPEHALNYLKNEIIDLDSGLNLSTRSDEFSLQTDELTQLMQKYITFQLIQEPPSYVRQLLNGYTAEIPQSHNIAGIIIISETSS